MAAAGRSQKTSSRRALRIGMLLVALPVAALGWFLVERARGPGPAEEAPAEVPAGVAAPGGGGKGAAAAPPASGDAAVSADEHYARARDLVVRSRADGNAEAGKEGLLQAGAELRDALRLGHQEPQAVQRLLAEVCAVLAREWAVTAEERREHQRCEREARREVVAGAPGDGDARFQYAALIDDQAQRKVELARAVQLAPRDPRPRRVLGEGLLEEGKVEEGARLLVEAAELYDPEEFAAQGPDIVHLLRYHGREEEAARVRERMESEPP